MKWLTTALTSESSYVKYIAALCTTCQGGYKIGSKTTHRLANKSSSESAKGDRAPCLEARSVIVRSERATLRRSRLPMGKRWLERALPFQRFCNQILILCLRTGYNISDFFWPYVIALQTDYNYSNYKLILTLRNNDLWKALLKAKGFSTDKNISRNAIKY